MIDMKSIKFVGGRVDDADLKDTLDAMQGIVLDSIELVGLTRHGNEFTLDFTSEELSEEAATEEVFFAIARVFMSSAVIN